MLFGEYIPFYDAIPWFTKLFPEASNFSRGSEPASFPLQVGGRDYRLGPLICYEDILPGFARRVAQARPQRVHQHHQRRLVRPHGRALPAPGAGRVPLGRAPARDDPRRQHGRLRAHRRRRPRPARRPSRSIPTSCRRRTPKTLLVDLAMLAGRRPLPPHRRSVRVRVPGARWSSSWSARAGADADLIREENQRRCKFDEARVCPSPIRVGLGQGARMADTKRAADTKSARSGSSSSPWRSWWRRSWVAAATRNTAPAGRTT